MKDDLNLILHLLGALGADSAYLLRGGDEATFTWFDNVGEEHELPVHRHELGASYPAILIARFPGGGDSPDGELTELRLPDGGDREIQLAAMLAAVLDRLTRIGPKTTERVLNWLFARYGINAVVYGVRDRPPKQSPPPPPDEPPDPARERVRTLRTRRRTLGFTQRMLAERAGTTPGRISAIESGNSIPGDAVWGRIEAALEQAEQEEPKQ